MKSLRLRFTLAFLAAALIPAAVVGGVTRHQIREGAEIEHADTLAATAATAGERVERLNRADARAVERLCQRDLVVDRMLMDLARGTLDAERSREVVAIFPNLMRSLGLDVLEALVAEGGGQAPGRVLASGHQPGRAAAVDTPLLADARRAEGRPFVRRVPTQSKEARALLTSCSVTREGVTVTLVGGRFLDDSYVDSLLTSVGPVTLSLVETGNAADGATDQRKTAHTFTDARGQARAHLLAAIDDAPLRERFASLDRIYMAGAAFSAIFAFLLAALLFTKTVAPLAALQRAARRVAEGDLESMVDVHESGEMGRTLMAFNRMTSELKATRAELLRAERIAAWRDIAQRIAHEIKNPLSPIQVSIETMQKTYRKKHPDFEEIFEESTATILEEVERLKRIVSEFSQFARLPRPRAKPLTVGPIVEHVVGLHSGGDVAVTMEVTGDPTIQGDREQLTQVLVNLVQNACDAARGRHGEAGAKVRVEVQPHDESGGVEVRVMDNGPGVPEDDHIRIFEPYFTTKSGGTGLGLAIVQRIVEDHGGKLAVESAPEGGALFVVTLHPEGPPEEVQASRSEGALPLLQRR